MKKSTLISIALITVLGIAVYANSLQGEFIWDDQNLIAKNTHLTRIEGLTRIFNNQLYAGSGEKSNFYRPLQELSYFFDYRIWRLNPFGYHLTNILIHLANAILVYTLVVMLSKSNPAGLVASLLFVIHPIHTQAVTYIAGRADLLSFMFVLLAFVFSSFAVILYPLALLAKESAIVFPIVFFAYLTVFKDKKQKAKFPAILIISFIYILLRFTLIKFDLSTTDMSAVPIYTRLLTALKAFGQYLVLLFYPHNLHMERNLPLAQSLFEAQVFASAAVFLLIIAAAFYLRRKSDICFRWGILWFLLWLIPHSNILPLNAFMAEHWLYLASVGFFLVCGVFLSGIYQEQNRKIRAVFIAAFAGYLTFLGASTIQRNRDWKDAVTFFEKTAAQSPHSHKAHIQLGVAYMEKEDYEPAMREYRRSIEIKPADQAYNNLGVIYIKTGRLKEAIAAFEQALELTPDCLAAYDNLASAYYFSGNLEMAQKYYKKALSIWSGSATTHNNLGVIYMQRGLLDEAESEFLQALRLDPAMKEAQENIQSLKKRQRE